MLRDVQTLLEPECQANLEAMVTFTDVEISNDYRYASIYYSVLGNENQKNAAAAFLERITKRVRSQLGRMLGIKYTPEIIFKFDPSVERGIRIQNLLNEVSNGDKNEESNEQDI
jgi:ribosome-binding factor A